MPGIQQPTKTPISESKIAVFWRTALYLFSAGMMGKAAAGFSDGYVAEAVGDLGLSLVFIGMCFRSTELAILAYISDPAKREAAIEKLRQKERAKRPWISHLMNAGWICLLAGVAGQLSNMSKLVKIFAVDLTNQNKLVKICVLREWRGARVAKGGRL